MKKLLLLTLILASNLSYCQLIIETEISNGLYIVPCEVNDVSMNFIFDTGATNVTISKEQALKLFKNGSIESKDILGESKYKTASGNIGVGTEIILKSIKIKNLELKNIRATIIHSPNAPLLLGQNVLSKLGKITLEENKLTIHNIESNSENCSLADIIPFEIGMDNFEVSLIRAKNLDFTRNSKYSDLNKYEREILESAQKKRPEKQRGPVE